MAGQVLYSGVACITDLMVKEGLINLDFAGVRAVMREMGKAMMGTGEATGEKRALRAAEAAIANPLIDDVSMKGARGLLISITGGKDLTLYEVDEAATRIREEVDQEANVIVGATFDEALDGIIRVSVVATGIDQAIGNAASSIDSRLAELTQKLRSNTTRLADRIQREPARGAGREMRERNPEKRRTSLLQRLAAVGRGRREEEEPVPQQSTPMPRPQPQAASRASAPAPRRQEEPHDPVSEYAKRSPAPRPAPQGLDPHGRPAAVHNPLDEDHLQIPAFLRRQAN